MIGSVNKLSAICTQFASFLMVGATGTTVHYLVLWIGVEFAGLPAAFASSVGFAAGSVVNYLMNYRFTFASTKAHRLALAQFYLLVGISFLLNGGLMWVLAHRLSLPLWWAQIVSTGICLLFNFAGTRWWVFRQ